MAEPGLFHSAALKSDGTVVAWGSTNQGPTRVPPGLSGVIAIAVGNQPQTVALKSDGTVVSWGEFTLSTPPVPTGLSGVKAIAASDQHVVALKHDGTMRWTE